MAPEERLSVEVVYALAHAQRVIALTVQRGTTVAEALTLSGLAARYPQLEAAPQLGIFGRMVSGETVLRDGDRVEVYRALMADPKQARRQRAAPGRR